MRRHAQAEAHILLDGHMRVERVGLKDHGNAALGGVDVVDHALADGDRPLRDLFETRNHAQERGLAAAARPDEHAKFAFLDIERDAMNDLNGLVALDDVVQLQS